MYETIDLVKDEDPDDLILLDQYEESQVSALEDFQTIDAEIIDYGICEEEYEETSLSMKSPSTHSTGYSKTSPDSIKLNGNKVKCLCVKVVDCNMHPWYYKRYKKRILEQKCCNTVQHTTDTDNCAQNFGEVSNTKENNEAKQKIAKCDNYLDNNGGEREDTFEMTPKINRSLEDKRKTMQSGSISKKKGKWQIQQQFEIEKDLNRINLKQIDFKKNKGLVGMKIKRLVDDKTSEKSSIKKKRRKLKECDRIEKLQNCAPRENLPSLGLKIRASFDEVEKTRLSETKKEQNKNSDFHRDEKNVMKNCDGKEVAQFKPMPKSKRIKMEKQKELEAGKSQNIQEKKNKSAENFKTPADLKTPTLQNVNDYNKSKIATKKSFESSNKSFQHINKYLEKVLKIIEKNPNMDNKTRIKNFIPKNNEDQGYKRQNKMKPVEEIFTPISSSFVEEKRSNYNTNLKKNVLSGDVFIEYKNALNIPDGKKCNNSKVQNGKLVDKIVSKLAQNQNLKSSKSSIPTNSHSFTLMKPSSDKTAIKSQIVQPTAVPDTIDGLSESMTETSKQPQKAAFENMNPKRKRSVKVVTVKNLGYVENFVNVNQNGKTFQSQQESPQIQQNQSKIQVIGRNTQIGSGNGLEPVRTPSTVRIHNYTPQKTQISAIVIRPTQTPNCYRTNMPSTATSNETYYPNSPDIIPRPHVSQTVPSLPQALSTQPPLNKPDLKPNAPRPLLLQLQPNIPHSLSAQPYPSNPDLIRNPPKLQSSQQLPNIPQALPTQPSSSTPDLRTKGSRPFLTQPLSNPPPPLSLQPKLSNSESITNTTRPLSSQPYPNLPHTQSAQAYLSNPDLRKAPRPQSSLPLPYLPQAQSMQPYSSPLNLKTNVPRPPLSQPFQMSQDAHIPLRKVRPRKRIEPQQPNNYAKPLIHECPHNVVMRIQLNANFRQNENGCMQNHYPQDYTRNAQNNYTRKNNKSNTFMQQPVDVRQSFHMKPVQANVPPGICNVLPNVYWPYITNPTPPPPPPQQSQPPLQNKSNPIDGSVIGRNPSGLVKKISITNSPTKSQLAEKEKNTKTEDNEAPKITVYGTIPVLSKSEMMKELEMAVESPEIERPLKYEPRLERATALKNNRPGPLSKKLKLNNDNEQINYKGYSPPILPIPTYQRVLSETHSPILNTPSLALYSSYNKEGTKNDSKKKSEQTNEKLKKISLKEYKKRAMMNKADQKNTAVTGNEKPIEGLAVNYHEHV